MNIQSAARYLELGYKLRRQSWHADSYAKLDCIDSIEIFTRREYWSISKEGLQHHTYVGGGITDLSIEDLLAEDWEIITVGIRKHFNKYGNIEYEDDTDWDNYESSPSSWDGDDE